MLSANRLLGDGAAALAKAGVPTACLDAEVLLAHALKRAREDVLLDPGRRVGPPAAAVFRRSLQRRLRREPVARITGVQEFWSLPFRVGPATLVPRPDSETAIEQALAMLGADKRTRGWRVLDLGTGTGCLLLALLSELPFAAGLGVDISSGALSVAKTNARALRLSKRASFIRLDWRKPLPENFGRFDLIICNPPYVPSGDIEELEAEVASFEPRVALDGGADGLDHYRTLVGILPGLALPNDAFVVFEAGAGQAGAVKNLLRDAGATGVRGRCDLAGIERAVSAKIKGR